MNNRNFKPRLAGIAGLAASALAVVGLSEAAAQPSQPAPELAESAESPARPETRYTWSAELVAMDTANNWVTVRAMLVPNPEKSDLASLSAGDDAMLTWTGISSGVAVRALERGSTSSFDRLTMPVEFVASELDGRYVSFKVPVPSGAAASLASLRPGMYVTVTSPIRARTADEAVIAIRPYNDVSGPAGSSGGSGS